MGFKSCPDCGCRVYKFGCINCNEAAYIEEQDTLLYGELTPLVCLHGHTTFVGSCGSCVLLHKRTEP